MRGRVTPHVTPLVVPIASSGRGGEGGGAGGAAQALPLTPIPADLGAGRPVGSGGGGGAALPQQQQPPQPEQEPQDPQADQATSYFGGQRPEYGPPPEDLAVLYQPEAGGVPYAGRVWSAGPRMHLFTIAGATSRGRPAHGWTRPLTIIII